MREKLSLPIPTIIRIGKPSSKYPVPWLICNRLPGENLETQYLLQEQAAIDLGKFVSSMQKVNVCDGPECRRGKPIRLMDQMTKHSIDLMDGFEKSLLHEIWEEVLSAKDSTSPPKWMHGDLHPGNLLTHGGKISAVVDFGLAGIGDPACDSMCAWTSLTKPYRNIFREIVQLDDDSWVRAKGWAFSFAVIAYPYYRNSENSLAKIAKRTIDEIVDEFI